MRKVLFLFLCSAAAVGWLAFFKQSLHSKTIQLPITKQNVTKKSDKPEKMKLINLDKTDEKKLMKMVVNACPKIISKTGVGTGFLFSNDGLIITALHVIDDDGWVYVQFSTVTDDYNEIEENIIVAGTIVGGSNDDYDVSFIHIDTIPKGVKPLKPVPAENLATEQPVWRFGYNDDYKWTQGMYSPKNCPKARCLVTMPVGPGGSGGPLVDGQGRVMGMFQSYYDSTVTMITEPDGSRTLEFSPSVAHFLPMPYITMWLRFQNLQ